MPSVDALTCSEIQSLAWAALLDWKEQIGVSESSV